MNSTIDHLLFQVQTLNRIKSSGLLAGQVLTQSGLDMCNEELSTIEAELTERQPEGEFVTLLGNDGEPMGFEPHV